MDKANIKLNIIYNNEVMNKDDIHLKIIKVNE